jgi:hypothetical protein
MSSSQQDLALYSNFGIGVDRKHTAKWRFPQENGTFRCSQEVYVYSEIALATKTKRGEDGAPRTVGSKNIGQDEKGHPAVGMAFSTVGALARSGYLKEAMALASSS